MVEWMMAHPWLTFWLGALALVVIDDIICCVVRVFQSHTSVSEKLEEHDRGAEG